MNVAISGKPQSVDKLLMFSAPRLGAYGAFLDDIHRWRRSRPGAQNNATSLASTVFMRPEIYRPPPIRCGSPDGGNLAPCPFRSAGWPFVAISDGDGPLKMRAPAESRLSNCRFVGLAVEAGLGVGQPVAGGETTCFLTRSGDPPRSV